MTPRHGLPDVSAHRPFVGAIAIDALGSGIYLPLSVMYFVRMTHLDLPHVGLAMSTAALLAAPLSLVTGVLVDRLGPKHVLMAANALSALGFATYPLAHSFVAVLAAVTLTSAGVAAFWVAFAPMVAAISGEDEREKWFGFLGALRNVGFAAGGLVSGLVVSVGSAAAYTAVVWANAASVVVSFVLVSTVSVAPPARQHDESTTSWRQVFGDRDYGIFVVVAAIHALCSMALTYAMPVYAVIELGLPGWTAGLIFVINTVMCGFLQSPLVARLVGRRRYRIVDASFAALAVGFIGMAAAGAIPHVAGIVIVLVATVVYSLGEMLAGPVLSTLAVDSRPASARGRYVAFHQLAWRAAGIVAPAAFSSLLALGRVTVWVALVGVVAVGFGLNRSLESRLPLAAERVAGAPS